MLVPKEYALVYNNESEVYCVVVYNDWIQAPYGCIMKTSDSREELEERAEWYNEEQNSGEEHNCVKSDDGYELTEEDNKFINNYMAQMMLGYPEDYGLI